MTSRTFLRSPATVGYLPWLMHRISAVLLIPLLAVHIGVQLYPTYGFSLIFELGIYRMLMDLTLFLVLLHAFLSVRATVLETRLQHRSKTAIIWAIGMLLIGLLIYRLIG